LGRDVEPDGSRIVGLFRRFDVQDLQEGGPGKVDRDVMFS